MPRATDSVSASEDASVPTRWSALITSCEKYGGIAASSPLTCASVSLPAPVAEPGATPGAWPENRSGSENAGHRRARPHPREDGARDYYSV